MARKELSDALRHEFFRSGSVLRSTFFTILSLLLAVMLLFQIWLYHNAYQRLLGSARESGEAFLTLAAKLSDENFGRLCDAAKQLTWNDEVLYAALFPDTQDRPRNFRIVTELKSFAADTRYVTDVILLCNHDGSAYSSGGDVGLLAELPTAEDFSAQALGPAGASSAALVARHPAHCACGIRLFPAPMDIWVSCCFIWMPKRFFPRCAAEWSRWLSMRRTVPCCTAIWIHR